MPETPQKLPLIPQKMPKWFWPLVLVVSVSASAFTATLCVTMLVRRKSEPVQLVVALAAKDPRMETLGLPLEPGFLISMTVDTTVGVERRDMNLFLKGPKGSAVAQVRAAHPTPAGPWQIDYLRVYLPQAADVIVLAGDKGHPPEDFKTLADRRGSAPVQLAFEMAQQNPQVAALGLPLEIGFGVESTTEPKGKEGIEHCKVRFPLQTPLGEALVWGHALHKVGDEKWEFQSLEASLPHAGNATVNLIAAKTAPQKEPKQ